MTGEQSCSLDTAGTPEQRLGVLGCTVVPGERQCSALTGGWSDGAGRTWTGPLAVLADHVLGEVANRPQAPGFQPVTTALSLDVLVPPPWPGDRLHARAARTAGEVLRDHVTASVRDPGGRLVAVASAWTADVPAPGTTPLAAGPAVGARPGQGGIGELLTDLTEVGAAPDEAVLELDATGWTNQNGTVHGGVWACAAELAATRLTGSAPHAVNRMQLAFLRPGRGRVRLTATALHRGRTSGLVEVRGRDATGRVCVHAMVGSRADPAVPGAVATLSPAGRNAPPPAR